METKTLAATATTTTDQGEFTAIAAAWTVDRERDVIHRGAFAGTIKHWRQSGKRLPLHWDHKGGPEHVIGHVDPSSMQETDDGLIVKGKVDIDGSDVARQAWRLVKNNSVGLSFGYIATKKQDRRGGGRDLHELDVFEISITPAPMHPDTRILEAKSEAALRRESEQLERGLVEDQLPDVETPEPEPEEGLSLEDEKAVRKQEAIAGLPAETEARKRSDRLERGLVENRLPSVETPEPEPLGPSLEERFSELKRLVEEMARRQEAAAGLPTEVEARKRSDKIERELISDELRETKVSAEPFSTSRTSNWVARGGGLPHYIQHIAHDLVQERGMSESKAIQMAIGICQRWARGEGNVDAETRAKAAAAIAEWEKLKAKAGKETGKSLDPDDEDAVWLRMLNETADEIERENSPAVELEERIKSLEETVRRQETYISRPAADPARRRSEQVALGIQSGGVSLRKSPPVTDPPKAQAPPEDSLRRETRDLYLEILNSAIGVGEHDAQ